MGQMDCNNGKMSCTTVAIHFLAIRAVTFQVEAENMSTTLEVLLRASYMGPLS